MKCDMSEHLPRRSDMALVGRTNRVIVPEALYFMHGLAEILPVGGRNLEVISALLSLIARLGFRISQQA